MNPARLITVALLLALAAGCGHAQQTQTGQPAGNTPSVSDDDDDSDTSGDGSMGPPEEDAVAACQGFAEALHSVTYGTGAGFGQANLPDVVLGWPEGRGALAGSTDVLSLGNGGIVVLDLGDCAAVDGDGPDIIVFENAFYAGGNPSNPFAEPGIVGASDDGLTFVDFPCNADAFPYDGCAGAHPVYATSANGIDPLDPETAGGEAFDLNDIGLLRARFIRIRDAGNGGTGGTAGFDLDAIAVINGRTND